MSKKIIIANIRYSDDPDELREVVKKGAKYVKRHGDTMIEYNELDFNKSIKEGYNYVPTGKVVSSDLFEGDNVLWIDSSDYLEYLQDCM